MGKRSYSQYTVAHCTYLASSCFLHHFKKQLAAALRIAFDTPVMAESYHPARRTRNPIELGHLSGEIAE